METTLLGTNGSLKGTFAEVLKAKRRVSLQLLNGKLVSGLVIGHPTDEFVVIEAGLDDSIFASVDDRPRSPAASQSAQKTRQVLVRYAAVATVEEVEPE